LNHLLRFSDGIPRKINMLCHSAMQAAFYAGEKKVSVRTAKKTAAEYQDSVGITNRRSGTRPLVMPALIVGTLAALLLLGFVYPNDWSDWLLHHTVSFGGASEPAVRPVKPVEQVKSEQSGVKRHSDSGARPKRATSLAPHMVESRALLAPRSAAPGSPESDVAGPATATEMHILGATPAAAAVSAGAQKQTGAPAAQRSQITVRDGDTLEKIAIRYIGSKSGINQLVTANPQLTNINHLSVGQVIHLPPGLTPKGSRDQSATARPVPNAEDSPER
jgi:LysM repeat protein